MLALIINRDKNHEKRLKESGLPEREEDSWGCGTVPNLFLLQNHPFSS